MNHPAVSPIDSDFDHSSYGLIELGEACPDKSCERWLFLWVILQALIDIGMIQTSVTGPKVGSKDLNSQPVHATLHWLLRDKKDFLLVCELAGVEPLIIRSAVRKFVQAQSVARVA